MTKALRGINLGGWLVAERWMTPDLFEGVERDGEVALVRELGYTEARRRLSAHRDTFIAEKDFAWIKKNGFDFVRLPVGYWLFEKTNDFIDGEIYLKEAFKWAQVHDLRIVLDFHGLQGSQNGLEHSGQVGKVRLYRHGNQKLALKTLEYMCKTYGAEPMLLAMEIINEPKTRWFLWRLLRYYDRSIRIALRHLRPDVLVIVSDAFRPLRLARALSRRGYGSRVVMDLHLYQMFDDKYQSMSHGEHLKEVADEWGKDLQTIQQLVPVMIGEWSAALPVAAYAGLTQGQKEAACVRYYQAQEALFDETAWAHSYWSYKTPAWGVWDYKKISQLARKHGQH